MGILNEIQKDMQKLENKKNKPNKSIWNITNTKNKFSIFNEKTEIKKDSRRKFSPRQETEILERQDYKCGGSRFGFNCNEVLHNRSIRDIHHIKPWEEGGKTEIDNGVALCKNCHGRIHQKLGVKKTDKKRTAKENYPFGIKPIMKMK